MALVTRSKVLRKVKQMLPDAEPDEVMQILNGYGAESYERGRSRVQLAMLKLCEGELERLEELVEMAKQDYRDVLAYAEYPEEMKLGFVQMGKLPPNEAQAIRLRDSEQYLEWLEG